MHKNFKPCTAILLFLLLCHCNNVVDRSEGPENIMDSEIPDNIYPDSNIVISTHTDFTRSHYPKRIKAFKENPLNVNEIVFLGNSITEQGGDWGIRVNNSKARNRGISGDTTEGVLGRLAEIIYFKPKNVFILIGINDLFRDDMTASMVFNNILSIVNQIHDGSAETKIYVQTILPTTTSNIKEKIQLTNQMLDKSESDQPYELIQLYTHFVTEENAMNMEMSVDGVHLNENGYNLWVKNIKNLIDK